jgi:hypothetical protein
MEPNSITSAHVSAPYTLEIKFGDGYVSNLDLKPALWGPVFEALLEEPFFCRFRLEDDTIRWPNDADFCPDVLRYWCEAGGVRSQEETDAHFAAQSATTS